MQKTLSALSAAAVGVAMLLGTAVSSFAAPVVPQPVQVTSNIEKAQYRDRNYRYYRNGWRDRRDWRRSHYRNHRNWDRRWDRRWDRHDRRWSGERWWRHRDAYMGGSGRSHQ